MDAARIHSFHDDDVFDVAFFQNACHQTVQGFLCFFVSDDMPGEGKGEEADSLQPICFNQPEDIELECKSGFAVTGGKLFGTVNFSLVAVKCI